jgi:uncharacterized protein
LIIEGLLTTRNDNGEPHVAPMGPVVDSGLEKWTLRPFVTSTTFRLLQKHPFGIFHVVDDVLPVAQSALGIKPQLQFEQHESRDWLLADCCHWYRLEAIGFDLSEARTQIMARVVDRGVKRPFWGWNRAKHAVLEATILATRLHLADKRQIADDLARLKTAVDKTAGDRERMAWELVMDFIARSD